MFRDCNIVAIANGDPPSKKLVQKHLDSAKKLVAIDGGLHICDTYSLIPDLITGDLDSIHSDLKLKYADTKTIYMPNQNKCDLEKTIEYLFENGAKSITVLGWAGRRIDHMLANMCYLSRYPLKVKFETEKEELFALPHVIQLECKIGQTLSFIPFGKVLGVHTTGLKWNLQGDVLDKNFVSISNMAVLGSVSISFQQGDLIACLVKEL